MRHATIRIFICLSVLGILSFLLVSRVGAGVPGAPVAARVTLTPGGTWPTASATPTPWPTATATLDPYPAPGEPTATPSPTPSPTNTPMPTLDPYPAPAQLQAAVTATTTLWEHSDSSIKGLTLEWESGHLVLRRNLPGCILLERPGELRVLYNAQCVGSGDSFVMNEDGIVAYRVTPQTTVRLITVFGTEIDNVRLPAVFFPIFVR